MITIRFECSSAWLALLLLGGRSALSGMGCKKEKTQNKHVALTPCGVSVVVLLSPDKHKHIAMAQKKNGRRGRSTTTTTERGIGCRLQLVVLLARTHTCADMCMCRYLPDCTASIVKGLGLNFKCAFICTRLCRHSRRVASLQLQLQLLLPSTLSLLCKASLSCSSHRCKRISDCRLFFCAICCCCCPFYSMPLISFQIAALLLQQKRETASAENRKNGEKGRSYTYAKNCSICGIKPPDQLIVLPCLLLQQLSQFFVVLFIYLSFSL